MNATFFVGIGALETWSLKGGVDKLKDKFPAALKYTFCYWPVMATILYFGPIPLRYANLYMDFCRLFW